MAKGENVRLNILQTRLSDPELALVKAGAKAEGVTISEFLRIAAKEWSNFLLDRLKREVG